MGPSALSTRRGVVKNKRTVFLGSRMVVRIAAGLMVMWAVHHALSFTSSISKLDATLVTSQQQQQLIVSKRNETEVANSKQPADRIPDSDNARTSQQHLPAAANKQPPSAVILEQYYMSDACEEGTNMTTLKLEAAHQDLPTSKSMRLVGKGELELYGVMGENGDYIASLVEMEGCVKVHPWPTFDRGVLHHGNPTWRIDPDLQRKFSTASDLSKPHTRIVFSCESSEYFGYQAATNAYAFLQSNQTEASWLRLLTAHGPDDLSEFLPTFQAPRTVYSKRYSPINKPDILEKWFHSDDAPHPDDTIVVIDPDNWLLKDLHPWTELVSKKFAYGQEAYYVGNELVQTLWKEVCTVGCNNTVDSVGVPYVIKASDLQEVLPLWRYYTILLNEMQENEKERFDAQYETLYMSWTSEMYGYNFACAHVGIQTTVAMNLQIRDVDGSTGMPKEYLDQFPMIHMGRAFFPDKDAALAEQWRSTDAEDYVTYGIQVWCKCNETASRVVPWPIPDHLDLVSYHTLRLMHEARQWMPIPENPKYRRYDNGTNYDTPTP